MSAATSIEWTETTWNPTTGCDRISPGCDHCYALRLAGRLKAMGQAKYQTDGDPQTSGPGFGVALHEEALTEPLRWRKPRICFVDSMADISVGLVGAGEWQVEAGGSDAAGVRQLSRTSATSPGSGQRRPVVLAVRPPGRGCCRMCGWAPRSNPTTTPDALRSCAKCRPCCAFCPWSPCWGRCRPWI